MSCHIVTHPLTAASFAAFGQILEFSTSSDDEPWRDAAGATTDVCFDTDHVDEPLSIRHVVAETDDSPFVLWSLECRPLSRRIVLPLSSRPFVFVVAPDVDGRPGDPIAFQSNGSQGVQYLPGVWHHAYASIEEPQAFCIIDGIDAHTERRILDRPRIIGLVAGSNRQAA